MLEKKGVLVPESSWLSAGHRKTRGHWPEPVIHIPPSIWDESAGPGLPYIRHQGLEQLLYEGSKAVTVQHGEGSGGTSPICLCLTGRNEKDWAILFSTVPSDRVRGSGCIFKNLKFHLNIRKHFFCCEAGWRLERVAQKRLCSLSPWKYSKSKWT